MRDEYIFQTLLTRLDRMEQKLDDHGEQLNRIDERTERLEAKESEVSGDEQRKNVQ